MIAVSYTHLVVPPGHGTQPERTSRNLVTMSGGKLHGRKGVVCMLSYLPSSGMPDVTAGLLFPVIRKQQSDYCGLDLISWPLHICCDLQMQTKPLRQPMSHVLKARHVIMKHGFSYIGAELKKNNCAVVSF